MTSGFASLDNFFYDKEGNILVLSVKYQARYIAHWETIAWRPLKKTITVNSVLACPSANCQLPMTNIIIKEAFILGLQPHDKRAMLVSIQKTLFS